MQYRMVISAGIYGETVVNIDPICECGCSFNKVRRNSYICQTLVLKSNAIQYIYSYNVYMTVN